MSTFVEVWFVMYYIFFPVESGKGYGEAKIAKVERKAKQSLGFAETVAGYFVFLPPGGSWPP